MPKPCRSMPTTEQPKFFRTASWPIVLPACAESLGSVTSSMSRFQSAVCCGKASDHAEVDGAVAGAFELFEHFNLQPAVQAHQASPEDRRHQQQQTTAPRPPRRAATSRWATAPAATPPAPPAPPRATPFPGADAGAAVGAPRRGGFGQDHGQRGHVPPDGDQRPEQHQAESRSRTGTAARAETTSPRPRWL